MGWGQFPTILFECGPQRTRNPLCNWCNCLSPAEQTLRGDGEVLLRSAFRTVPLAQWKDLVQQLSVASGFGGEVTNVSASAPEKTDEAFHFSYNYTRKDYSDWSNRRITPPVPMISLPDLGDDGSRPSSPIWLGAPGEIRFQAQVELPKGYIPHLPPAVHIKREFADYDATYGVKNGVLTAEKNLAIKTREVRPDDFEEYKKFREDIDADYSRFTVLSDGKRAGVSSYQELIWELPYSDNPEAARAYDQARQEFQKSNPDGEIASLQHAVEIDPKFARAWLWLGEIYKSLRRPDLAIDAYRKALEVAPEEPVGYKALGYTLMAMRRFEDAIPVWQNFSKVAPDDSDGPANLAICLTSLNRDKEAVPVLESAVKINPAQAELQMQLGSAYLKTGNDEKALASFQRAIDADSGSDKLHSNILNSVAYELAEKRKDLSHALQYAEEAVREEEDESSRIQLRQLEMQDLSVSNRLAAYWDTLGWVYFQLGNLNEAEKYLKAAWVVTQEADIGDHLGQLYEKLGKKQQAVRAYGLALQALGRNGDPQMRNKLNWSITGLAVGSNGSLGMRDSGVQLSEERTYKLPQVRDWGGGHKSAEFAIVLTKESGVTETRFLGGAQELRSAASALGMLKSSVPFPDDSHARIVRRGVLSCSELAKGCVFVFYPADAVLQPLVGIPSVQQ